MAEIVDARGLSCPEPVLLTLETIKKLGKGEIEILVDTDTSRENVSRAATSMGWQIENVSEEGSGYRIRIKKD
ncbi:TusA-related sulfurtransferase [Thermodesulfovibrio aggregans]|uniref:TusA-related sulfurtransferase n=1 Tax=Thermodesulfovibrio aggregans TaxID=86166 RepID=A0A0U9HS71_9BACT|nr:sulfurtransferase TusA family protein [Thermodesulfovibrio aggregans]GAQ95257.1 TusA-related sulfurtransferase [Thermodesulfovibrio aggregans]